MTPTPTQIATQAAEAYYKQMNEYCMAERERRPDLAALILAAAAKMVREAGAVEALELANRRATAHRLDDYYATGGAVDHDYEAQIKTSAALEKLRSISEGEARS